MKFLIRAVLVLSFCMLWADMDMAVAQLPAKLDAPPDCSMDNPNFNNNVYRKKCSSQDILNNVAMLPAPAHKGLLTNKLGNKVLRKPVAAPLNPLDEENTKSIPPPKLPTLSPAPETLPQVVNSPPAVPPSTAARPEDGLPISNDKDKTEHTEDSNWQILLILGMFALLLLALITLALISL